MQKRDFVGAAAHSIPWIVQRADSRAITAGICQSLNANGNSTARWLTGRRKERYWIG